jgi:hypothetical protein
MLFQTNSSPFERKEFLKRSKIQRSKNQLFLTHLTDQKLELFESSIFAVIREVPAVKNHSSEQLYQKPKLSQLNQYTGFPLPQPARAAPAKKKALSSVEALSPFKNVCKSVHCSRVGNE